MTKRVGHRRSAFVSRTWAPGGLSANTSTCLQCSGGCSREYGDRCGAGRPAEAPCRCRSAKGCWRSWMRRCSGRQAGRRSADCRRAVRHRGPFRRTPTPSHCGWRTTPPSATSPRNLGHLRYGGGIAADNPWYGHCGLVAAHPFRYGPPYTTFAYGHRRTRSASGPVEVRGTGGRRRGGSRRPPWPRREYFSMDQSIVQI